MVCTHAHDILWRSPMDYYYVFCRLEHLVTSACRGRTLPPPPGVAPEAATLSCCCMCCGRRRTPSTCPGQPSHPKRHRSPRLGASPFHRVLVTCALQRANSDNTRTTWSYPGQSLSEWGSWYKTNEVCSMSVVSHKSYSEPLRLELAGNIIILAEHCFWWGFAYSISLAQKTSAH